MPHLVTDAIGAGVMVAEATARVATPVTGPQPLELAAWQRSPSGERCSAAAVRHWERHLPSVAVLTPALEPEQERFPKARFTSPAMAVAVGTVAARTGVDPSTILSTAFMMAVGHVTGAGEVAVRHLVGNRFRAGLAEVVSPLAQLGLCVADVAVPLDEALGRVARASLAAQKHAYYNPLQLAELLARTTPTSPERSATTTAGTPAPSPPLHPVPAMVYDDAGRRVDGPDGAAFLHIDDSPAPGPHHRRGHRVPVPHRRGGRRARHGARSSPAAVGDDQPCPCPCPCSCRARDRRPRPRCPPREGDRRRACRGRRSRRGRLGLRLFAAVGRGGVTVRGGGREGPQGLTGG